MKKNRFLLTKQFVVYCMIGGFTSLMDTLVFYLLRKFGINLYIANFIGINVGITLSFLLNSFINFKMTNRLLFRALKFFAVGYIGLVISFIIMYVGVDLFHFMEIVVKLFSIVFIAIIQFCLNKIVTFKSNC